MKIKIHDKTFTPYLKHEEILEAVNSLAMQVYKDYKNETPVFVGVLNGVIMFFTDFLKAYPGDCRVGFIQMSSYFGGLESTGIVYKQMDITIDVRDKHVVLMEDIVDTGNTIENLFLYFKETQRTKSLKVATAFMKPDVYKKDFKIDYVGMDIPDKFVVGYGLDYDGIGRNLPDLYRIEEGKINE